MIPDQLRHGLLNSEVRGELKHATFLYFVCNFVNLSRSLIYLSHSI